MANFQPTVFIDITAHLEAKVAAMQMVTAQIKPFPHCRSAEALRALAALRGSTVGRHAAEAFVLIRQGL
jgi:LmbE family N-acetylglucosaminyl deacetylase